jgi:hypothetical protein
MHALRYCATCVLYSYTSERSHRTRSARESNACKHQGNASDSLRSALLRARAVHYHYSLEPQQLVSTECCSCCAVH